MSARVCVEDLQVVFGGKPILDGVTLTLAPGRLHAVVGPNGAGKTTLVRCLSGLQEPTRGRVEVGGQTPWRLPARDLARLLAYMPQSLPSGLEHSVLWLALTGRRTQMGVWALETRRDVERARAVLEELGIDHLADRSLLNLSGGELQLAVAASALAQRTQVILMDEPTSMLDPAHQVLLLERLRVRAHDEHALVLCVLHDLNLASRFFDEIHLLHQGRLAASGSPGSVMTPERLGDVYGDAVEVFEHKGRPVVVARSQNGPGR